LEVTSKKHELLTGDLIQKVETPRACEDGQPRILIYFDQHATESIASAPRALTFFFDWSKGSYLRIPPKVTSNKLLIYFFGKRKPTIFGSSVAGFPGCGCGCRSFCYIFYLLLLLPPQKKNTRRTEHL
jgi:hypothetical protein